MTYIVYVAISKYDDSASRVGTLALACKYAIKLILTYDPHSLGPPQFPLEVGGLRRERGTSPA